MFGDPSSEFTRELGMELTHPGPREKGLYGRSKRFAMYVKNCMVEYVAVSETEDDPAGDDHPGDSCAEAMIEAVKEVNVRLEREERERMEKMKEEKDDDAVSANKDGASGSDATAEKENA